MHLHLNFLLVIGLFTVSRISTTGSWAVVVVPLLVALRLLNLKRACFSALPLCAA